MIAYHNDPAIKSAILEQLEAHAAADEIIKGDYWEDGKGCAVGCTIYSSKHIEYETLFGIPVMLARLEDCIFEGLPNETAKAWPVRFMSAIKPGQDLSLVGWKFLYWILTDVTATPGIMHPLVRDTVAQVAGVICSMSKGNPIDTDAARSAAEAASSAARSVRSAAKSAAWSAARSAVGARSAWSAARAALAAADAAWFPAQAAAEAAADAAEAAALSAEAAYIKMADHLIALIEDAPVRP